MSSRLTPGLFTFLNESRRYALLLIYLVQRTEDPVPEKIIR